jgi:hypothetical protein
MTDQHVNVDIDSLELLAPLVAAQLVNATYSNALLRQMRGEATDTPEVVEKMSHDVIELWGALWESLTPLIQERRKRFNKKS